MWRDAGQALQAIQPPLPGNVHTAITVVKHDDPDPDVREPERGRIRAGDAA